jgi:trans-2-enoyl-CoA reductase
MMFSRSAFRAASRAGPVNAVKSSTSYLSSPSVTLPLGCRRYVSAYGYTQAKALIYSKYGEPKDVLRYGHVFLSFIGFSP